MTPLNAPRPDLRLIVSVLGGDLYDGGRRANVPAPGHGPQDRSVSLMMAGGRLVIHGFGAAGWREVLADLRARGLVSAAATDVSGPTRDPDGARAAAGARIRTARALWDAAGPGGPSSLAARHLRVRGVVRPLAAIGDLRSHPAAPVSAYRPGGPTRPALLAAIRDPAGEFTAAEITYLAADGRRAADLRLPRKTIGRITPGSAVRLDPAGPVLLVAEGVFTALSAAARFDLPAWALLSVVNLRRWAPPPGVRTVLVAGDRGAEGEAAAAELARRLRSGGLVARVKLPPAPFGDWNEAAAAGD